MRLPAWVLYDGKKLMERYETASIQEAYHKFMMERGENEQQRRKDYLL